MKNKKLKSLDELNCLLPAKEQQQLQIASLYRKFVNQHWPYSLRTERRLLPMLPAWMRRKITFSSELYNHSNPGMDVDSIWNHTFTLPLNDEHEITFAMIDNDCVPQNLRQQVELVVDVYRDLQLLYARFGLPLTIVSLQSEDFGIRLPVSFYHPALTIGEDEADFSKSCPEKEAIMQSTFPLDSRMSIVRRYYEIACNECANEQERVRLNTWFAHQDMKLNECNARLMPVLASLRNDYCSQLMWECIDIYMNKCRVWDREYCIKWNLDDNEERLKKIDRLRPIIDRIIKKTQHACFAFGVKRKGAIVIPCDHVCLA